MQIELDEAPDPAIRALLFAAIDRFNDDATGLLAPARRLGVVLRGADGQAEGGVFGISYYDWMIVQLAYLPPALRGHRLGTLLLRAAEGEAARRGCRGMWLDTYSFQARPFYERLGFAVFGTLEDHPPGHSRHFLAKRGLRDWAVAPGVEVTETPAVADEAAVDRALTAFNDAVVGSGWARPGQAGPGQAGPGRAGPGRAGRFAVLVRDGAGTVQGGLWAEVWRGWMFVDLLVLPAALRGMGLGRRLLGMAEDAARARGCVGAWLDTYTFQAPGFYRKLGWREFGRLDDYPPGQARHFLCKRLDGGATLAEEAAATREERP